MRSKSLWLIVALLATLPAGAQMVNQTLPYSGTTTNPCNGETVVFNGTIHLHEKTQVSGDGRIHFVANDNISASGTGQSTGRLYNISGYIHTNSKFPSFPITFRQRSKVTSSGSYDNFFATFAFHINGNGVQTQVTMAADCNG